VPHFVAESPIPWPREALAAFHLRPGALDRLLPPWQPVRVEIPGPVAEGARVTLRMGHRPLGFRFVAEHRDVRPPEGFSDVQVRGPFARFEHRHRFLPEDGADGSRLRDEIFWTLPGGAAVDRLARRPVERELGRMLAFRHRRTRSDLSRQLDGPQSEARTVAITGATGLIGTALAAYLGTAGHEVRRVTRRPRSGTSDVGWDPAAGRIDAAGLAGVDAVIHLAGESLFGGRWTAARKRAIRESRVQGTRLLVDALARLPAPPGVLLSCSAVGFYGNRGDAPLPETAGPGEGFLAELCRQWEAEATRLAEAGTRVVHLRMGVVLSARGGALGQVLPLFRLGLGGPLGDGRAWLPWISLDDAVYAVDTLLRRQDVSGPVNLVAPEPVRQRDYARTLARVLRRPALLPAPAPALRLAFGELADEALLCSARVRPEVLLRAGYRFEHPDLEDALRFELGRTREPAAR